MARKAVTTDPPAEKPKRGFAAMTPAQRAAATAKSQETRARNAQAKRDEMERLKLLSQVAETGGTAALLDYADEIAGAREQIPARAFAGALRLVDRIQRGDIADSHLHYAAQAIEKLVGVARLEQGQATALTAHVGAQASQSDFAAWMDGLRTEIAPRRAEPPQPDAIEATSTERTASHHTTTKQSRSPSR